ncbi:MAG: hypothetical protein Q4A16_11600 [Lautropia sp.]|nr:hypothetical protein [Lautropia sp.]
MAPDNRTPGMPGTPTPAQPSPPPHGAPPAPPQHFQFPDDSDDDYLEDDEAGPLDEDAALATLPPLTEEDRALIDKLMHSMRLLDIGISTPGSEDAELAGPPTPFPSIDGTETATEAPPTPRPTPPRPVPSLREARVVQDDADAIPMLTDVVNVQRYHQDQLPQNFGDVDWGELAAQIRENVLERLLRRGDILMDAQMSQALTPVITRAVETLTLDMHNTLNRLIRDIVARAVTEEITRLHAEMARQNPPA